MLLAIVKAIDWWKERGGATIERCEGGRVYSCGWVIGFFKEGWRETEKEEELSVGMGCPNRVTSSGVWDHDQIIGIIKYVRVHG